MGIKTVNERIAFYRKKSHLSQNEVAERIGMKGSTYSQMERRGNVSAERLKALAEVFEIKAEELLYGEEEYKILYPENSGSGLPLAQEPAFPKPSEVFVPTNSEISLLKVFRRLSQKDKAEVRDFIQKKRKVFKEK